MNLGKGTGLNDARPPGLKPSLDRMPAMSKILDASATYPFALWPILGWAVGFIGGIGFTLVAGWIGGEGLDSWVPVFVGMMFGWLGLWVGGYYLRPELEARFGERRAQIPILISARALRRFTHGLQKWSKEPNVTYGKEVEISVEWVVGAVAGLTLGLLIDLNLFHSLGLPSIVLPILGIVIFRLWLHGKIGLLRCMVALAGILLIGLTVTWPPGWHGWGNLVMLQVFALLTLLFWQIFGGPE